MKRSCKVPNTVPGTLNKYWLFLAEIVVVFLVVVNAIVFHVG